MKLYVSPFSNIDSVIFSKCTDSLENLTIQYSMLSNNEMATVPQKLFTIPKAFRPIH